MKPWNIGNNKVLNIKMPFCLHWCQFATLSLIFDFFFFYNFLSSVCLIVVLIKFCFCSTQYYRFCCYYVPFFVLSHFDVFFHLMNVLFILLCMFKFFFFFLGRFYYVFRLKKTLVLCPMICKCWVLLHMTNCSS